MIRNIIKPAKELTKAVEDAKVIRIRNDYLGHSAIGIADSVYRIKNDDVKKVNDYLLDTIIETIHGYSMFYVLNLKKKGDKWFAKIKRLMGDNRDFIAEDIETPTALETEKVLLISQDYSDYLILDPLLHFGECSECHTENLFFFDKRHKEKVQYFNFLHVHKPFFDLLGEVKTVLPLEAIVKKD